MIKTFKHKGLKKFFFKNDSSALEQKLISRIRARLTVIDVANHIEAIDLPCFDLRKLKGDRKHVWSINVFDNWRIRFKFMDGDAEILDLKDFTK